MEAQESPLSTENFNQQVNTHKRRRYDKQSNLLDPFSSYPPQQCVPAKSELSELVDPYLFGPGMPDTLDADLFKKIQAEQGSESLYWKRSGSFGSDLLDNIAWSTASSPLLDTVIAQYAPQDICMEEQGMDEKKDVVSAAEAEKRSSKGRKRSISPDHTVTGDKEQRRIQHLEHVVRDLQNFENQQRKYGKQQLKAIKDSPT